MVKLPKIKNLVMTCGACPTQWDAVTEEGENVYIRYRWGKLTAHFVENGFPLKGSYSGEIYSERVGDEFHGVMDTEQMEEHLSGVLDFSNTTEEI